VCSWPEVQAGLRHQRKEGRDVMNVLAASLSYLVALVSVGDAIDIW
jgi:hypothetical protein